QWHLGGGNQVEGTAALGLDGLEELLLELRQLAGPDHRFRVDQVGDPDLLVARRLGVPRVQVEHELNERALEPGAPTPQHGEAGPGEARAPLEVEDPQDLPDLPVRARWESEPPGLPPAADLDVVLGGPPDGH